MESFTFLSDILHVVSQALLAPDIILLLAFILYALFSIGSIIAEYFTERKYYNVVMPKFLASIMSAKETEIPTVIKNSGLLRRQKIALYTVYEYRALPGDALLALVRRLVSEEETHYGRITSRDGMAAKVAPMLGLMGTLIPLGPGIQALGSADTQALSASLLVAFDTTVAGLVTAAVYMVIAKIRSNWYSDYLSALDSSMATMMEKIEDSRKTSKAVLPEGISENDYSFLFEGDVKKDAKQIFGAKKPNASATGASVAAKDKKESAASAPKPAGAALKPAPAATSTAAPKPAPKPADISDDVNKR